MDVEKHYQRKENLLFPYLEKYNITGPPKVMWGKHDEIRELLKSSQKRLDAKGETGPEDIKALVDLVLRPASDAVADMVMKEEEILLPVSMDKLSDEDWYEVARQSMDIGYCLYGPETEWIPEGITEAPVPEAMDGMIKLPTGRFSVRELNMMMNAMPLELTFVDSNDKVRYFSHGNDPIFKRNRAVLGRDVRLCHPPGSVQLVEQILGDFKSSREDRASFWLEMGEKFVYIDYFAIRDEEGNYLGTMEAVQNIAFFRGLGGEHRLLSYSSGK